MRSPCNNEIRLKGTGIARRYGAFIWKLSCPQPEDLWQSQIDVQWYKSPGATVITNESNVLIVIVISMSPPFNITTNLRSICYILSFDMHYIHKSDTKFIAFFMGGHQNPIYCLVHLWCNKCKRKNISVHHFLWDGDSANAITRFPRVSYPIQLLWRQLGAPNDHIAITVDVPDECNIPGRELLCSQCVFTNKNSLPRLPTCIPPVWKCHAFCHSKSHSDTKTWRLLSFARMDHFLDCIPYVNVYEVQNVCITYKMVLLMFMILL